MYGADQIGKFLQKLEECQADDLEDQWLDFKQWNERSMSDSVDTVVEMAVCMANGGGGTVVFGVKDWTTGRGDAVLGVPPEVDINKLKRAVFDKTDPRLTPDFEEIRVPEGTGRLIVMRVIGGLRPYTDTAGRAKIRIGKDCQPLTGSQRSKILVETGENDFTAVTVPGSVESHISAAAIEQLREVSRQERGPEELLTLSDVDLLRSLGVIRNEQLTRAGLLLVGKEESIRQHIPGYSWTHLRMRDDTDYSDREDGSGSLSVALRRITDRIMSDNPITTVASGMFHHEYRAYPEIALREALMNALCHSDYRIPGPVMIKQFPRKIEISSPGGFIGGISPENILHHTPISRNPHLVEVLMRLRLVNRSNLGISRMFQSLLVEGKEPPTIQEQGEAVRLTFFSNEISASFRGFVADEEGRGVRLSVDHLLILQYLLRHAELDTATAAEVCQRQDSEVREILSEMERDLGYLERGGTGRGTYWILRHDLYRSLISSGQRDRDRRIDWEAAKTRVLSVLKVRAEHEEPGLSNAEIRGITHMSRGQVKRLMSELREEGQVELTGPGRTAMWLFAPSANERNQKPK